MNSLKNIQKNCEVKVKQVDEIDRHRNTIKYLKTQKKKNKKKLNIDMIHQYYSDALSMLKRKIISALMFEMSLFWLVLVLHQMHMVLVKLQYILYLFRWLGFTRITSLFLDGSFFFSLMLCSNWREIKIIQMKIYPQKKYKQYCYCSA